MGFDGIRSHKFKPMLLQGSGRPAVVFFHGGSWNTSQFFRGLY